ncbi:DUF1573 domain-containing protein [candidate division GN15 bacterium]|nr:DUF1573 domain-containing protein [candidate division GN15 bacterium]
MKQFLLTSSFCLMLLCGSVLGEAELTVEPEVFEFGQIPRDSRIAKYFWLESTGADTVFIDSIKTGCVCALMPLERDTLAPGDKVRVGVFWDIGKRMGSVARHPYIFFNQRSVPAFVGLRGYSMLHMDNLEPVTIIPHRVELPKLPGGTKSIDEVQLVFRNLSDEDIQIRLKANSAEELVDLEVPDFVQAGDSALGRVAIKPEFADEAFERSFTVEFSDEKKTRLTIPVRRKIY